MTDNAAVDWEPVRKFITDTLREEVLPSLAVAVAREGRILWEEAFGWADRERRIPATPHTLYSLASISKPITATAVMVLREEGRLDPDRPIQEYLGPARLQGNLFDAAGATVRRVADHTSGLPLHYHFFFADEPHRPPSRVETIRRYGKLFTAPGERFHYSNLGYGLLDYAVEQLSGQAYRDFLREKVFLPLGMTRSSVDVAPELEPFAATRYGSDQVSYPHYDFDHPGGSAVYCSAHDLLRFGMFHAGTPLPDQKEILTPETRQEMQRPTSLRGPGEYGFGWNVQADDCGVRSVSHSGGMGGVNTLLKVVPEAGIVIVTLCNAACRLPFLAAEEILARLLPTYAGRLAEKRATPPEPSPDADPPQLLPGEWSGYVDLPEGSLPFQLRVRGNGDLHARVGEQLWALVNDVLLEHQTLTGRFAGDLGTEDTRKRPGYLHLDLQMQERQMLGALVARSELPGPQGGAPARRMGNALSHWCLLERRST